MIDKPKPDPEELTHRENEIVIELNEEEAHEIGVMLNRHLKQCRDRTTFVGDTRFSSSHVQEHVAIPLNTVYRQLTGVNHHDVMKVYGEKYELSNDEFEPCTSLRFTDEGTRISFINFIRYELRDRSGINQEYVALLDRLMSQLTVDEIEA